MARARFGWLVILPKLELVGTRFGAVKLRMIHRIERLQPQLQVHALGDIGVLHDRKVEVVRAILANGC